MNHSIVFLSNVFFKQLHVAVHRYQQPSNGPSLVWQSNLEKWKIMTKHAFLANRTRRTHSSADFAPLINRADKIKEI